MKVPNNKLSSVKDFFFKELSFLDQAEVKRFFEFLCEAWLGLRKSDLILNPDQELSESEILKFLYGIKDLKKNKPVQYVAGLTWFYGLEIGVSEGVLIPRPETEELVDWIVKDYSNALFIADVGTGSGCIPLALRSNLPNAKVLGLDISVVALEIASKNASKLNLEVDFSEFDALNWYQYKFEDKFDVIVSNPPYIPHSDKELMHENVLLFEPELALFVPNDSPLLFYQAIADFANSNLKIGGALFFEIHESFGEDTLKMLQNKGFSNLELRQDLQGKDRMIKAIFG